MKISTKGRYALRMLLDLAEHRQNGYITLKDIAQRQNISKKYLEQIVPVLNKSNILMTNRGYQGGYRLAKAPEKCTVGEILRLTEGSLAPVACLETDPVQCLERAEPCHQSVPGRNYAAGHYGSAARTRYKQLFDLIQNRTL